MHSETGNDGVILETVEYLTIKSPSTRQGRGTNAPPSPSNLGSILMLEALIRTSFTEGTPGAPHVEKTPDVVVPNHVQPLLGSPGHDGF